MTLTATLLIIGIPYILLATIATTLRDHHPKWSLVLDVLSVGLAGAYMATVFHNDFVSGFVCAIWVMMIVRDLRRDIKAIRKANKLNIIASGFDNEDYRSDR